MSVDSPGKTVFVAATVALVCSVLVSSAAVFLNKKQGIKKERERKKNILLCADLLKKGGDINQEFKKVTPILIDLETGTYTEKVNVKTFNRGLKEYMSQKKNVIEVANGDAILGTKEIPKKVVAYIVKDEGKVKQIILPVYGKGLWSSIYGFLSVAADGETVRGITFYQQGETPGLGGEIENPRWTALWKGKKIFDKDSVLKIRVIKGKVQPESKDAPYDIDGLSGATLTSRGVSTFVRFWLGKDGFGLLLKNMAKGGALK